MRLRDDRNGSFTGGRLPSPEFSAWGRADTGIVIPMAAANFFQLPDQKS